MNKILKTAAAFTFIFCGSLTVNAARSPLESDSVRVSGNISPDNSLTLSWLKGYSDIDPDFRFSLGSRAAENMSAADLFFCSEGNEELLKISGWKIPVAHDAVVGLINGRNPFMEDLREKGIPAAKFLKVLQSGSSLSWGELTGNSEQNPVKTYHGFGFLISQSNGEITLTDSGSENERGVFGSRELIMSVQNDIYSIGFIRLSELIGAGNEKLPDNVVFIPVDKNNNGRLDPFEDIYDDPQSLLRGTWIGKYPRSLSGNIYAAALTEPSGNEIRGFIKWILTDGKNLAAAAGFSSVTTPETESGLSSISRPVPFTTENYTIARQPSLWIILVSIVALFLIISFLVTRLFSTGRSIQETGPIPHAHALTGESIEKQAGILYDKTHTWAFMEKDGLVRIGIDDFIQHVTGSLTDILLKETGEFVRRGEKLVTIVRSGKQLNLYAPVSGRIRALNTSLQGDASLVNSSPLSDGWLYLIEPSNWLSETKLMLMADKYSGWISDEIRRLKEFLSSMQINSGQGLSYAIIQDGGEITDYVLSDMKPETWEDFQTKFIDSSKY